MGAILPIHSNDAASSASLTCQRYRAKALIFYKKASRSVPDD
jgi:hypothetical protein